MSSLHWPPAPDVPRRGRVLLIHGLSSLAHTWWRAGPELARRGWDVTAVDQAGHGGGPAPDGLNTAALAEAVLAQYPDGPDVLIGHSLGTVAALAVLERRPGWAPIVVLEDPPGVLLADGQDLAAGVALSLRADAAAVQRDRAAVERRIRAEQPRWADEDVHWAVEGIARMDAEAFAHWLEHLTTDEPPLDMAGRILAADPVPYVLAAVHPKHFLDGGSALLESERLRLEAGLPAGHVISIPSGHCVHREAFTEWLAAVDEITERR